MPLGKKCVLYVRFLSSMMTLDVHAVVASLESHQKQIKQGKKTQQEILCGNSFHIQCFDKKLVIHSVYH